MAWIIPSSVMRVNGFVTAVTIRHPEDVRRQVLEGVDIMANWLTKFWQAACQD